MPNPTCPCCHSPILPAETKVRPAPGVMPHAKCIPRPVQPPSPTKHPPFWLQPRPSAANAHITSRRPDHSRACPYCLNPVDQTQPHLVMPDTSTSHLMCAVDQPRTVPRCYVLIIPMEP